MVFATGLCTTYRLDFGTLINVASKTELTDSAPTVLVRGVGKLAHTMLKEHQRIRGFDDRDKCRSEVGNSIITTLVGLYGIARERSTDLVGCYIETLEKVLQRNWKADPAGRTAT
jgi:hypothetical protein